MTDYYGELLVHRAGLSTREEYLDTLSSQIEELQTTPGRLVQSVELASFDAWIKYYRPDENSRTSSISYYTKGLVHRLPARREDSQGHERREEPGRRDARGVSSSIAGARGFTPDEFRVVAEQVAGTSLKSFWETAIEGTAELDYTEALDDLRPALPAAPAPGTRAYLGATTRNDAGRLVVAQVRRDTPALTPASTSTTRSSRSTTFACAPISSTPPRAVQAGGQGDAARRAPRQLTAWTYASERAAARVAARGDRRHGEQARQRERWLKANRSSR